MHNSLNSTPFRLQVGDTDIGVSYHAVYDEDTEQYTIYNGPDQMTADAIGEACTVEGARQVAREDLAALRAG